MSEIEEKQEDRQEDSEPSRRKRPSGPVRMLQGERLRNYAAAIAILLGALPAVGSLIVSLVTAYRGEPVAQKTWETLRAEVNKQAEAINKLHLRIVHFQGHQEGQTAAELQHKLDDLQRKYDEIKEKDEPSKEKVEAPKKCRSGQVLAEGKCRSVPRAVNDLVKKKEEELKKVKKEAEEEKRRHREEERKRIRQQTQKLAKPAPPLLKGLPKHLDDVAEVKDD